MRFSPLVTAYKGDMKKGFALLNKYGYDGVELNVNDILSLAQEYNLEIPMIVTGEVFAQEKLSLIDESEEIREEAVNRMKKFIDFASVLKQVNIGRFRGQYQPHITQEKTDEWAMHLGR